MPPVGDMQCYAIKKRCRIGVETHVFILTFILTFVMTLIMVFMVFQYFGAYGADIARFELVFARIES